MKTEHLLIITLVILLVVILLVGSMVIKELKETSGDPVKEGSGKSTAKVTINITPPTGVNGSDAKLDGDGT